MSQIIKFNKDAHIDCSNALIASRSFQSGTQLTLINNHEPLLKYIDLIIKYAIKTGDFGQYTSLNIVASELGDFMVNIITEYKNASLYNDKYKMEDIVQKAGTEVSSFIKLLSQFIVCSEDSDKKRGLIIDLGELFINRYNESFFKNVLLDTYDIDNERVYWEKVKYKMHSIYEQNMKVVLKRQETNRLPWYKKLFITDVKKNDEQTDVKSTIEKLCIKQTRHFTISDKPTYPPEIYNIDDSRPVYTKRAKSPKGHNNIAKIQARTKGY
jgi:hypothetical protein